MKFVIPADNRIPQFSLTPVLCSEKRMAAILAAGEVDYETREAELLEQFNEEQFSFPSKGGAFRFVLKSGAEMVKCITHKNKFYVYSYAQDGRDFWAAMHELKYLNYLRLARLHRGALGHFMGSSSKFTISVSLNVEDRSI